MMNMRKITVVVGLVVSFLLAACVQQTVIPEKANVDENMMQQEL